MKTEVIEINSNDLHTGQTIRTYNGHYLDVFNPNPDSIDIEDIAHALSHVCRFGGHTWKHYSVAQHSMEVAKLCTHENKLAGLLHDASEAYMCDMPRPIKRHLLEYKAVENILMEAIAKKFGLRWPMPSEIKHWDNVMLEIEHKEIILQRLEDRIVILDSAFAKDCFLTMFHELIK